MPNPVETSTPANTPTPIGPYNHIAKVGEFISIGGTAGVNPATGKLAGVDAYSQTSEFGGTVVRSRSLAIGCPNASPSAELMDAGRFDA